MGQHVRLIREPYFVHSSTDAVNYLMREVFVPFDQFKQEQLYTLLLDQRNRITHDVMIYKGTVNAINIRPAEIFMEAVRQNSPSIILSHCHPSGDAGTKIRLLIESDPINCDTEAKDDSSWECTPSETIPYGTHTVTITATSKAGHTSTLPKFYLIVSSGALKTEIIEEKTVIKSKPKAGGSCTTYVVKPGDNLIGIAQSKLGDESKYKELIVLNKDRYPQLETNPRLIQSGWELLISCPQEEQQEDESTAPKVQTYDVKVRVVDTDKNPVKGAKVTLFSTPREAVTDENGEALFKEVEKGQHTLAINHNGQVGEQKVNLDGDVEEFQFTVQIKPTNPFSNPYVVGVVGILVVTIAGLLYLLLRRPNR